MPRQVGSRADPARIRPEAASKRHHDARRDEHVLPGYCTKGQATQSGRPQRGVPPRPKQGACCRREEGGDDARPSQQAQANGRRHQPRVHRRSALAVAVNGNQQCGGGRGAHDRPIVRAPPIDPTRGEGQQRGHHQRGLTTHGAPHGKRERHQSAAHQRR